MDATDILAARETRAALIKENGDAPAFITVKANMPGKEKVNGEERFVVLLFKALLHTLYQTGFHTETTADGHLAYARVDKPASKVKRVSTWLEATHPIGRLVDIDVHENGRTLHRTHKRHCMVCGGDVHTCRRNRRHSHDDIVAHYKKEVHTFFKHALAKEATMALRRELFTYPCYGLVSHKTSGIHRDMNVSHFLHAFPLLEDAFKEYIGMALNGNDTLEALRTHGQAHEKRILERVGRNTHKGAHFLFGLTLTHFTRSVFNGGDFDSFLDELKTRGKTIEAHDFSHKKTPVSTGEKAYRTNHIRGVRGEVSDGFPSIFSWWKPATRHWHGFHKLTHIMAHLDDTTLYKRGTLEDVKETLKETDILACDMENLNFTLRKASPGGAADLLGVLYFFESTGYLLNMSP